VNFVGNFVHSHILSVHLPRITLLFSLLILSICLAGCGGNKVHVSTTEELIEFEKAGPVLPTVDMDRLMKAKISGRSYRVVADDVLELTMPGILKVVTAEEPDTTDKETPYLCRVSDSGTITLPVIGELNVAGKSLGEIEAAVIDTYYPTYAKTRPSVFVSTIEYKVAKVSVTGAVTKPGVYELRNDEMSLVTLLMKAEGIVENGAARIQIVHADAESPGETFVEQEMVKESGEAAEIDSEAIAEQIEVELFFEVTGPTSSTGNLALRCEQTTLQIDRLDLSNEAQVQALLDQLAKSKPSVPAAEVQRKLSALAAMLTGVADVECLEEEAEEGRPEQSVALEETMEQGPAIAAADESGTARSIILPVRGANIPFADLALRDGDSVMVERLQEPIFTVIGLVNKPGNFPYPSDVRYNLMQAVAYASGLNQEIEPRYATIYRLKQDGGVVHATFKIVNAKNGTMLTDALAIGIKPGDIVAIEHSPETRSKQFINNMFERFHWGVTIPYYLDSR